MIKSVEKIKKIKISNGRTVEVVGNDEYGESPYSITLDTLGSIMFKVYGYSESEAIDNLVDHCEFHGYDGLYMDTVDEFEDEYIVAGSAGFYVEVTYLSTFDDYLKDFECEVVQHD